MSRERSVTPYRVKSEDGVTDVSFDEGRHCEQRQRRSNPVIVGQRRRPWIASLASQ
jgi:hypothetical protein